MKPVSFYLLLPIDIYVQNIKFLETNWSRTKWHFSYVVNSRTKIYSLTWRESGLNLAIMSFLRRELNETKRDTRFVPLQ